VKQIIKAKQEDSYANYLNEIGNGKPNLVIDSVITLITKKYFNNKHRTSVADFGCFDGTMLNAIYKSLPREVQRRVLLTGFDNNRSVLDIGADKFPHIKFSYIDFLSPGITSEKFDIVILSNVLHEIYSQRLPDENQAKDDVVKAFDHIERAVREEGFIVFMDGLLPDKSEIEVELEFYNREVNRNFHTMADKADYFLPIHYSNISSNKIITSLKDLSLFLTKYRYLNRPFWNIESQQVYPYFTQDELDQLFRNVGLRLCQFLPQPVPGVKKIVSIIKPSGISIPYKNVLIVAQK